MVVALLRMCVLVWLALRIVGQKTHAVLKSTVDDF